jgi:hypothetical protein
MAAAGAELAVLALCDEPLDCVPRLATPTTHLVVNQCDKKDTQAKQKTQSQSKRAKAIQN